MSNSPDNSRPKIDSDRLEIRPLDEAYLASTEKFSCGDEDLDDFLRTDALRLQRHNIVRTFVAFYDAVLVGFVSLMNDAIVLETRERKSLALSSHDHPVVPALKIARLGVSQQFRQSHRGTGEALVRFAYATALSIAEHTGCRLLTLDAYEGSVAFYERLGFARNRAKGYRERKNPSMRLDVFTSQPPAWLNPARDPPAGAAPP
jgi:ribosomal protein S18 acetylase RimI-like enzyme